MARNLVLAHLPKEFGCLIGRISKIRFQKPVSGNFCCRLSRNTNSKSGPPLLANCELSLIFCGPLWDSTCGVGILLRQVPRPVMVARAGRYIFLSLDLRQL